jgi:hypothetical protein
MKNNKDFGLSPNLVNAVRSVLAGKPVEDLPVEEDKENEEKVEEGGMKRGKYLDTFKPKPVKEDDDELDDVDPKAVKKKFKDRKDKDIDNDGDTDDSDKFLHKKRKAISKAIAKDDEDDNGNGKEVEKESVSDHPKYQLKPRGPNAPSWVTGVPKKDKKKEVEPNPIKQGKSESVESFKSFTNRDIEWLEEASKYGINHRTMASKGLMHKSMAGHQFMKPGHNSDFYAHGTGDKISGVVRKNDGKTVHVQADKDGKVGIGKVHKFKVTHVDEEVEVDEGPFANAPKGMKFPTTGVKSNKPPSRQLKDKKKEMMVHHPKTGVKVIDKKDWKMHKAGGYTQAEEVEFDEGYQVYVKSPTAKSGWIPQGKPHKTEADAKKDAKNFRGVTRVVKEDVEVEVEEDGVSDATKRGYQRMVRSRPGDVAQQQRIKNAKTGVIKRTVDKVKAALDPRKPARDKRSRHNWQSVGTSTVPGSKEEIERGKKGKKDIIDLEPKIDESQASRPQDNQKGETKPIKQGTPKAHDCAKKVVHEDWGRGTCLPQMHAEPDEVGNVAWYDVMFEHGIEKEIDVNDLEIIISEGHTH